MGVINQLSFDVANLIAAGEVVDRPASAIKELMENSIDAGARRITVETKNGGVTFMRVSDDGCGMEPEDLPMAIRRHATSKISSAEDLDGICTLGFRGEALAAISSVSKLRIISKREENQTGAMLDVDCGEILGLYEHGCSDGTTIIAEELFANVPARRKFLKRDVTETSFICTNVEKIALSHPEIAIRLICDGQIRLETAGDGNLKNTIYSIFGKDFASKLIEVKSDFDGITVHGFIGRSDNVKGNRGAQNFYINNRFIKSKTATAAIEQAYSSYMPTEKFPVCVLFIDMSPGRVDVNVHPAKLEVKFSNEKPVFEAVYYAVKQALESDSSRPQIETMQKKPQTQRYSEMQISVERPKPNEIKQMSIDVAFGGGKISYADKSVRAESTASYTDKATKPEDKVNSAPAFERITAEEYVNRYINGDGAKAIPTSAKKSEIPPAFAREEKVIERAVESIETKSAADAFGNATETHNKAAEICGNAEISGKAADAFGKAEAEKENSVAHATPLAYATEETLAVENNDTAEVSAPKAIPEETKAQEVVEERKAVNWRFVGEVFNSYLICEVEDKLLLIDKHAAHERIIFEELKANMKKQQALSQLLMIPIEVMLMSDEIICLEEYRRELESIGFGFTTARNTAFVNEIPVGIDGGDVPAMMAVFADRLKNGTGNIEITKNLAFEKALYQASCKAAIKAGREYAAEHHLWIIKKLMEIPDITVCPHGRPVAMELSHKNINRQFERT